MFSYELADRKLSLVQGDITKALVEAIVNAANSGLRGGGGVDGAIHRAAGPKLLQAGQEIVRQQGPLPPGEAVITPGFELKAKYVIHTVGPIWRGGGFQERELLDKSYKSCLLLAQKNKIKSIAFPAISCGAYGFPLELAAPIALKRLIWGIKEGLVQEIYFYLYAQETYTFFVQEFQKLLEKEN
jgi:O-acetyl-ADP-ribose deacetylase (regulator of RNase III)